MLSRLKAARAQRTYDKCCEEQQPCCWDERSGSRSLGSISWPKPFQWSPPSTTPPVPILTATGILTTPAASSTGSGSTWGDVAPQGGVVVGTTPNGDVVAVVVEPPWYKTPLGITGIVLALGTAYVLLTK